MADVHLARDGAAALSLRSIARDLDMAPSALYRYFDGRDALLSALLLSAYESLADEAVTAAAGAAGSPVERWTAVPRAMRTWALAHTHQWGLLFGSPVPGYAAPEATVVPYTRLARALVEPLLAQRPRRVPPPRDDTALAAAVQPVTALLLPDFPAATVATVRGAWSALVGVISLEVFGHWRNTVLDPPVFFEALLDELAAALGLVEGPTDQGDDSQT